MKSLLDNINELDMLLRQLQKLASRIRSGENVDAWRECNTLISYVTRSKQDLIKVSENSSEKNNVK